MKELKMCLQAMNLEKSTLRTVKDRTEDQVMPYVSTHNPKNPEIYNVIQFNLLCKHLIEGDAIEFKCGRKFYVHESMTSDVKNVLYVIKCSGCGEEYIGQTGDYLRKRVTVHN